MLKKTVSIILISLAVVISGLVLYIIWDNNRITVSEQIVPVENLPSDLDGFSILQISDLHEKEFGDSQEKLIQAVNAVDYDAIIFTGDMLNGIESTNFQPFYALLEGIENKQYAWFVPGNTDPESYQVTETVEKSEFVQGMEERSVELLESSETITIGNSSLHMVNFELSLIDDQERIGAINGTVQPSYINNERYLTYRKRLWEGMPDFESLAAEDVVIALNHYPVVDVQIERLKHSPGIAFREYDLIVAGHYHGGQIRVPFYGALFVPEPWYEQSGILPPRDRVSGLWEYADTKQYVSTGLGSSDFISFLKFRFINPPEINVLTLQAED